MNTALLTDNLHTPTTSISLHYTPVIFDNLYLLACQRLHASSQSLFSVSFLHAVMMLFFKVFRQAAVGPSSLLNARCFVVLSKGASIAQCSSGIFHCGLMFCDWHISL